MKTKDRLVSVREIVDHETGEVKVTDSLHYQSVEPPFIKLYLDCLAEFKGLSKSLNPILIQLLSQMSYASMKDPHGGQIIYLNAALKRRIAEEVNKSTKRIEQAITDFVKAGIFTRIATGTYQVNPKLFGRGEWKDVKNIRATFDFGAGTINTEIIHREPEDAGSRQTSIEDFIMQANA